MAGGCFCLKLIKLNNKEIPFSFLKSDCIFILSDPIVRSELMEQIPHIAVYCHDNEDIFPNAISTYILPMVVRYLDDANNQVFHKEHFVYIVTLCPENHILVLVITF